MGSGVSYPQKSDEAMLDFVRAAYAKVIKKGFEVICRDYQDYLVGWWFSQGRDKSRTGSRCTWFLDYRKGTSAKHASWTEPDAVSVQQNMKQAHAQWTHFQYDFGWFRQELLMVQNDADALYDLMASRRVSEQVGAMEDELEPKVWTAPTDEADAEDNPMGIPFWVQKNKTTGITGGWNGGDPSGFTNGAGGITVASAPGWNNYTGAYTAISNEDLIKILRRAMYKLRFKAPGILGKDIPKERMNTHLLMGLEMQLDLVDVAKNNNDRLGWDLGKGDMETKFYGHGLEIVPYLDNDTDNPIYLIDYNTLFPITLKGDRFRESKPKIDDKNHNCYVVFTDLTYQYVCTNRKRNGVICSV